MRVITHYFSRHLQAALNSLGQLSRTPLASFMTCLVIGIALALPTALFVGLKNLEGLGNHLQQTMQITLYLKTNTKDVEVEKLTHQLEKRHAIAAVKTISPTQGLKELQQQAGFEGILAESSNNPLPWTMVILPRSADDLEALAQSLQQLPQVESLQLDQEWVKRLESIMLLAKRGAYLLTIFLGVAVFLIINNAIRAATQQNQKEIEVIKLIGGTTAFIRRPFLYAGMLYGLLGGILAWQLVDILLLSLKTPLNHLMNLYHSQFQLLGVGLYNTLILLGCSILLGLFGSWLAVSRRLKNC